MKEREKEEGAGLTMNPLSESSNFNVKMEMKIQRWLCACDRCRTKELRTCFGFSRHRHSGTVTLQLHILISILILPFVVPVSGFIHTFKGFLLLVRSLHFYYCCAFDFGLWLKLILARRSNVVVCARRLFQFFPRYACVCLHDVLLFSLCRYVVFFFIRRCRRFHSHSINITWNIQQSASNELYVRVLDKCINIYQANKYKVLSTTHFL